MKRKTFTLVLAGAAAVALAGVTAAAATLPHTHVMTIRLPGGGMERLSYTGDVAPRVIITSAPISLEAPAAVGLFAPSAFPAAPNPFAAMERISAEMNREMARMLAAGPGAPMTTAFPALRQTSLASMPAGAQSYTLVSTFSGGQACTHSVEVTSMGPGKAPKVISRTSGDCAGGHGAAHSAAAAAPSGPKQTV